jgi:3-hydroxyisobutyrate dehydrogenase
VAWQAFGEAFAMAKDAGWPPKRLLDLFTDSNGANNGLKMRADMIVAMMEGRDPGATTFSVANACKDLRTMLDTGKAKGISLPAVEKALAGFEELRSVAPPESDASRLPVYWATRKK